MEFYGYALPTFQRQLWKGEQKVKESNEQDTVQSDQITKKPTSPIPIPGAKPRESRSYNIKL